MTGFARRMSVSSIFSSFSAKGSGGGGSEWQEADSDSSSSNDDCIDVNKKVVKGKSLLVEKGPKSKTQYPSHKPSFRNNDDDDEEEDEDDNNVSKQKGLHIKHVHSKCKTGSLLGSQQVEDDDIDADEDDRHQRLSRPTRTHQCDESAKSRARNHGNEEGSKRRERSCDDFTKTSLRRHQSDDREGGSVRRTRSCDSEILVPKDEHSRRGRRSTRDLDDDRALRSSSRSVASRSVSRNRSSRLQRARSKSAAKSPKPEKKHASLLGNDESSDDDEPESFDSPRSKRSNKPNVPDLMGKGAQETFRGGRHSNDEHSQRGRRTLDLAQTSPRKTIRGHRSVGVIDTDQSSPRKSTRGCRSMNEKLSVADQGSPRKSLRGRCSLDENLTETVFKSPKKSMRGQRSTDESSVRGRRSTFANGIDDPQLPRWSPKHEKENGNNGEGSRFDNLMDRKADAAKRDASRQEISAASRNGHGRSISRQRNSRQREKTSLQALGNLLNDKSENDDDLAFEDPNQSKYNGSGGYLPSSIGTRSRRNCQPGRTDDAGADDHKLSLREIIKSEVLNNDQKSAEKETRGKGLESRSFRSKHSIFGK